MTNIENLFDADTMTQDGPTEIRSAEPVEQIQNELLLNDAFMKLIYDKAEHDENFFDLNVDEKQIIVHDNIIPVSISEDYHPKIDDYFRKINNVQDIVVYVQDIVEWNDETKKFERTSEISKLSDYNTGMQKLNNIYGNFKQLSVGLLDKIGALTHKIVPTTERTYLLKNSIYSEEIFYDDLIISYNLQNENKLLKEGLVVKPRMLNMLFDTISNNCFSLVNEFSLLKETKLNFYRTVNSDIERLLNKDSNDENVENKSFFSFDVDEKTKFLNVKFSNDTRIVIPADGKIYIYISSDEQPYILNSACIKLGIDYIK